MVEVRPLTGSVILYYDPKKTGTEDLLRVVATGLTVSISLPEERQRPSPKREAGSLAGRLWWFAALTATFVFSVVQKLLINPAFSPGLLSIVGMVCALGAIPLIRRAVNELRERRTITLFPFLAGTCVIALLAGETLTALEVIWVTDLSTLLEDYVADRSRREIRKTLQVSVKSAFVLRGDREIEIAPNEVAVGDTVSIREAERIPVDGVVLGGEALVNEAHITGRAEGALKKKGDPVYAGTIVEEGSLLVRAEGVGEGTYLGRMVRLVEESLTNRAPAERRADILARRLTGLGVLAVIATFAVTGQFVRALTVMLVAACPCATILAAETAVTAAISNAARRLMLVKGGLYLERIGEADTFCFDKTGTITRGAPEISQVVDLSPRKNPRGTIAIAAAAEARSVHPLAGAIRQEAARYGIVPRSQGSSRTILGRGVEARIGGATMLVGNSSFMRESGIDVLSVEDVEQSLAASGHTVIFVAKNGSLRGIIAAKDAVRPEAEDALKRLRADGVAEVFLITGDGEPSARAVSQDLGFDACAASLLPDEKARYVEKLRAMGKTVVMVGDGVNDALALSKADVSIAMGAGGAEAAIETADISLADSDLRRLASLRHLSHETLRVIEQNHWLAVSTNVVGIVAGAAGWITPLLAGFVHILHTAGIMANSSRLLRSDIDGPE
jgi:manganese/zinc-transporting P-type ATPase C